MVKMWCIVFCLFSLLVSQSICAQEWIDDNAVKAPVEAGSGSDTEILTFKSDFLLTSMDGLQFVVTIHEGSYMAEISQRAVVYTKAQGRYKKLLSLDTPGFFEPPNLFSAVPKGRESEAQFLRITDMGMGTGHDITEFIYCVAENGSLERVSFVAAPQSFYQYLNPGEGIWKGENNQFTRDGLYFSFYIWNSHDPNCCPTAGKVTGTYEVVPIPGDNEQYEIRMFGFRRTGSDLTAQSVQ